MSDRKIILDESQQDAVDFAINNKFSIINGGAGTGKTTIIRHIADTLEAHGATVYLCAFAGKAAARLREATGHSASTIHRMLDYRGDAGFMCKTLRGKTVIMDESSMVSSDLLAEVVSCTPDRLILVGDQAQLPPVGCGQPFHDIVHCVPSVVRTLTTCYRNSEAIFKASGLIRAGQMPAFREQTENEFWEISQTGGPEATHQAILDIVKNGEVDFMQDIILCCRNGESTEHSCSVEAMNHDIKAIVNPSKGDKRIEDGDRVICTKNCPDLDVWNGTTGTVKTFDYDGGMWVTLDCPAVRTGSSGETIYVDDVLIPRKQVIEWQLAYALTTHKSQGSQYRKVYFVCLHRDVATLLDRAMLYTAVTRARVECHVMGESRALWAAISKQSDKLTIIQELARQLNAGKNNE